MIATLLAFLALATSGTYLVACAVGRGPALTQPHQASLFAAPPAVLVLASTAQLNWSITQAVPYIAGAGIGSVLLFALTPGRSVAPFGLLIGQAAWMLTCLGAVTTERLYLGSGRGQSVWAACAVVAFLGAARVGARWRSTPTSSSGAAVASLGCIGIALPLVPGIGITVNGASGWVRLGPLIGQPGELARILLVIGAGLMLFAAGPALRAGRPWSACVACWPLVIAAGIGAYTADFGPVLVLGAAVASMVLLSRPTLKHAALLVATSAGVVVGLMMSVSRLRERVEQMLHPVTPSGDLHNTGAALRAFANGGLLGRGFGDGNPHAVSNVENDFVLAAVAEERGLVGIVLVAVLFAVLTSACWKSALRATSGGPRLSAAGLASIITVQALYVAFATLTIVPVTGMVVPFLSHGGSALIAMWTALGLIIGVGSHHVVQLNMETSDGRLTRRMQAVSTLTSAAWVAVVIAAFLSTVIQPAGTSPARSWKGGLVTGDGTTLIAAAGSRQPDRTYVPHTYYAPDLVTYVDDATGQRACTKTTYQVWMGGQCIPATVVSSLRDRVQRAAEAAIRDAGDAVALDLHTGHVIALYERPTDHSRGGISPVEQASAPGSTFKTVTAAAALSRNVPTSTPLRETYTPPGGTAEIRNAWRDEGGGSLTEALAESSNTAFAELAIRAGGSAVTDAAQTLSAWNLWGTDHRGTGIDVGPDLTDADSLARTGFGQEGVRATPLAMAVVAGKIATSGHSPNPALEAGRCSSSGGYTAIEHSPKTTQDFPENVVGPIREGMERAVTEGYSGTLQSLPFPVAAKTGTAENPNGLADGWVIAYAPADKPRFSVAVRIWADPTTSLSRSGAADAAPVAAAILGAAMNNSDVLDPCSTELTNKDH